VGGWRWIDLIGEDVFVDGLADGPVEASQQLPQSLAAMTNQHRQAAIFIGGGGDATDRVQPAEGDIAVLDQLRDVGQQGRKVGGVLHYGLLIQAAGSITGDALAARFQGNNSSMRRIG